MVSLKTSFKTVCIVAMAGLFGCGERTKPYGTERPLMLTSRQQQVWAIAPALNLSGVEQVDPLLQADLVYQQLQQVQRLTVIPVNRVVEVYAGLRIEKVQSQEQAELVCEMLGCDALLVPTVTAYDPYTPPKLGATLQLFPRSGMTSRVERIDPREMARRATPPRDEPLPARPQFLQAVGMFDAANGSVRQAVLRYAEGRNDPAGPLGPKEYFVSMDRYCGFAYHQLITDLLSRAGR
jgi:hypothetical protein